MPSLLFTPNQSTGTRCPYGHHHHLENGQKFSNFNFKGQRHADNFSSLEMLHKTKGNKKYCQSFFYMKTKDTCIKLMPDYQRLDSAIQPLNNLGLVMRYT